MFYDRGTDNIASKWEEWYSYNMDAILSIISDWNNNEGIHGYSCKQYKLQQYYLAFYYVYLIYVEMSYGVHRTFAYYEEKYGINDIRKKLLCNGINLNYLLDDVFEIVFEDDIVPGIITRTNGICVGFTCEGLDIDDINAVRELN